MAKIHPCITDELKKFILKQHMFFVASAPLNGDGHVNLSPKGLDSFRILGEKSVAYMDIVSSGNETSAHIMENGRITFMFCSYDGSPSILRLYGRGHTILPGSAEWEELSPLFKLYSSSRQIIAADINRVQTSCGYGVPMYEYRGDRKTHFEWAQKMGLNGLEKYKHDHSMVSIDGLPTALGLGK
jgi:hypothetical protein